MIRAFLFDLDGVLVDTARFHFVAWRQLAQELGFDLSHEQNEKLKGVSRVESLNLMLHWAGISLSQKDKDLALERKNRHYLELVDTLQPGDCLPGVIDFLASAAEEHLKIALGSASKNAQTILKKLQLDSFFDVISDGTTASKSKPDPEVFLYAARHLHLYPTQIVVFEDALSGIEAAKAGGFHSIGIGVADVLNIADRVISGFENLHAQDILSIYHT